MQPVVSSWVGSAAAAPLVLVLLCWALVILHYHRQHWRSVDLFVVALLAEGVVKHVLTFAVSILTLLRPELDELCSVVVWGLTTVHALEAATLASLVVDRALTLRWPYRYRFSVRCNQIRYHVSVLAVISCFVGVAGVFARPLPAPRTFDQCSFLPHQLDPKFSLFAVSLHGMLALAALGGAFVVQCQLCTRSSLLRTASDLNALSPTAVSDTSTASTSTSGRGSVLSPLYSAPGFSAKAVLNGSGGSLRGSYGWAESRRGPAPEGVLAELRWVTVLAVLFLCYLVNHLPVLALTVVGTFLPGRLPDWPLGGLTMWAGLAQDCLLPAVLALVDCNFAPWVLQVYSRRSSEPKKTPQGDRGSTDPRFRVYNQDVPEVKFPLTNGSLFTSVDGGLPIIHNYRRGKGVGRFAGSKTACLGLAGREIRGVLTGPRTPDWLLGRSPEPLYSDPLTKLPSDDKNFTDDEPIYATLSDTVGTLSSLEDLSRCCSVTTAANDDFEFHGSKTAAAALNPDMSQVDSAHSSLSSSVSGTTADIEDGISAASLLPVRRRSSRGQQAQPQQPADQNVNRNNSNTLQRKMTSSLSMNDLDLIEKGSPGDEEEEMVFVLPVKSESILSLYRLYLQDETRRERAKQRPSSHSETKLNSIGEREVDSSTFSKTQIRSSVLLGRNNRRRHKHGKTPPPPPRRSRRSENPHRGYKKYGNMVPRYQKYNGHDQRAGVLSMESLCSALSHADVSYMDNGDLCRHGKDLTNSEPDFKKVFVSDFI